MITNNDAVEMLEMLGHHGVTVSLVYGQAKIQSSPSYSVTTMHGSRAKFTKIAATTSFVQAVCMCVVEARSREWIPNFAGFADIAAAALAEPEREVPDAESSIILGGTPETGEVETVQDPGEMGQTL